MNMKYTTILGLLDFVLEEDFLTARSLTLEVDLVCCTFAEKPHCFACATHAGSFYLRETAAVFSQYPPGH